MTIDLLHLYKNTTMDNIESVGPSVTTPKRNVQQRKTYFLIFSLLAEYVTLQHKPEPLLIKYIVRDADNALTVIPSNYAERRLPYFHPTTRWLAKPMSDNLRERLPGITYEYRLRKKGTGLGPWAPYIYKRGDLLGCRLAWRKLGIWQESRRVLDWGAFCY